MAVIDSSVVETLRRNETLASRPTRVASPPLWAGVAIPDGFELTAAGVVIDRNDGPQRIAGPIWVVAYTRDGEKTGWGLMVRWLDRDGHLHERAIPKPRLHEPGTALAQELASEGLDLLPGKERELNRYLAGFEPEARIRSVNRLGWLDDPEAALVFVQPSEILSRRTTEQIIYQPERYSPSSSTLRAQGALEAWQYEIATRSVGNNLLTFAIGLALAAPLLKHAHLDGGGFHLYGGSSRGKTTALQVATSVWGCGADPAEAAGQTAICRWNTTKNGLEGLAAAHNDTLLALDELGSLDADDFDRAIYNLAGGQGKVAMDANRNLKEQRVWRNLILSTGEISGLQKIQECRRTPKAGQQLRFMDIPTTDGIIVETRGLAPAEFANQLKRACGQSFGTAGPAFVRALIERFDSPGALEWFVTQRVDTIARELAQDIAAPEHRRAVRKLALIALAGELAQEHGILPPMLDIRAAVESVRDAWLSDHENRPSSVLGARAVKAFILRRRDSFRDRFDSDIGLVSSRDICGYYDRQLDLYLFTDEGFAEACSGHNPRVVAAELVARGLLNKSENRYKTKQTIRQDGVKRRPRLYAVKGDILDQDFD